MKPSENRNACLLYILVIRCILFLSNQTIGLARFRAGYRRQELWGYGVENGAWLARTIILSEKRVKRKMEASLEDHDLYSCFISLPMKFQHDKPSTCVICFYHASFPSFPSLLNAPIFLRELENIPTKKTNPHNLPSL